MQDSSPSASLERRELIASKPLSPIGDERRMCRPGDGVFVDTDVRDEHPADDVLSVAARGHTRHSMDLAQRSEIRLDGFRFTLDKIPKMVKITERTCDVLSHLQINSKGY